LVQFLHLALSSLHLPSQKLTGRGCIENTSRDLETFAKHAGRRVINTDDVMLLSRRNEGLERYVGPDEGEGEAGRTSKSWTRETCGEDGREGEGEGESLRVG
jgi:hypothetical protein